MDKKNKILKIREQFDILYPEADCTLEYNDAFHLLVATQLAAQCTDARVNLVTPALFAKFPDPAAFAAADIGELEELIRSTGFFHNKARNLKACGEVLCNEFGGKVPGTMEELLRLPGVGRKTANLVLGDVFGKPGIVVDTHAGRIARRIGLTKNQNPTKVEFDLLKIVPKDYQTRFCHQLVLHGRAVCRSQNPKCMECTIAPYCNAYNPK
ncbi:MAG: endonuclease III [Ruminococcaceae bacterium]|nr:endonuclease III [Oscillospiraceae bacterium]